MAEMLASHKISKERYGICKKCPMLTTFKFCKSCGCFMPLKTKLLKTDCPKGYWGNPFNTWGGK